MGASHLNDSLVDPGKREEMRRWLNDFHFNPQLLASQAMLGNAASSILRGPMRLSLESPSVLDDDTMTLRSSVWSFCGDEVIDHGEAHLEPSDDLCMESRLEIILQDEGVYEHATDLTHVYEMPDDTEGNGCEHQMLPTEDMMTASDPDGFVENQQGGEDPAVEALHVDDGLSKSTAQDGMETGVMNGELDADPKCEEAPPCADDAGDRDTHVGNEHALQEHNDDKESSANAFADEGHVDGDVFNKQPYVEDFWDETLDETLGSPADEQAADQEALSPNVAEETKQSHKQKPSKGGKHKKR